jgi:hypothetical protein
MKQALFAMVLALCAAGCSDALGYGSGIPELRVLRSSYRWGDTVRAELVNRSPRRIELAGCGVALEQRTSDGWVTRIPEPRLCAAVVRLLGAGAIASRRLPLPDSLPGGPYRLREMIMLTGRPPESPIYSPTFTITPND